MVQCTEQSVPKPQVLLGDGGSFAMGLGDGGNKRGEPTLVKIPLVRFAEVEISKLYRMVLSQNTPALLSFPGVYHRLPVNDGQQNWPGSQKGGGKCSVPESHRTLLLAEWETGKLLPESW